MESRSQTQCADKRKKLGVDLRHNRNRKQKPKKIELGWAEPKRLEQR